MSQDIRLWKIAQQDNLMEINKTKLDMEDRLENWLEKDISIISNELLVIGRQIETDFGGVIDLLCIDYIGDLVIVELKRDKTPREITAQVLDYASWVKDLSNERVTEIAIKYLSNGSLDEVFKSKFGTNLPDVLNENHKMLIVASEIDGSTERIVNYLSDDYGISINAITFQHFKEEDGNEYLSRVYLIEPQEAEYRTKIKTASKRKPPLTLEELQEIADKNSIGEVFKKAFVNISEYFDQYITTRSSIAFIGIMGKNKARNTIFSLLPFESNLEKGLKYSVYIDRFTEYLNLDKKTTKEIFPAYKKITVHVDWAGEEGQGYFRDGYQIEEFLKQLRK